MPKSACGASHFSFRISSFFCHWSWDLLAQRCVRSIAFRAYSCVDSPGAHSSNAMMISAPNADCISITFSGAKKCFEPSRYERKWTHSSVTFARGSCELLCKGAVETVCRDWGFFPETKSPLSPFTKGVFESIPSPREKTWNPPESVRIGKSTSIKLWSPPNDSITSVPGFR